MTDRVPSVAEIQAAVCEWFNVRPLDMKSHRRSRCVARPRQVAMYLAVELTPLTLAQIGRHFGGRDHTTVVHAVRIVPAIADHDPAVAEAVGALRLRLSGDPNQFALKLAL